MTTRAYLIDLDDTLVPDVAAARAAFRATAKRGAARASLDASRLADDAARLVPFPDALPALDLLEGHPRAILTNGPPDLQREKLARSGLAERFDVVVISGDIGRAKPDPFVFEITLERLGVAAGDAVMVGNSLKRDVAGAQAAGLRAVWVDREGVGPSGGVVPDAVVGDLRRLPEVLD